MNPKIANLLPYPFQQLAKLLQEVVPPENKSRIQLSVGEPKHPAPACVVAAIQGHLAELSDYPSTRGPAALRQAIADWLIARFHISAQSIDPERHVLPVCGTREALYSVAQAVLNTDVSEAPRVIMPNPFYQIYEGAALLAGAKPYFLNTGADNLYKMDITQVPSAIWQQTQLIYLCTPGNPTGAVMTESELSQLIELADKYDFIIASDECYSEIYFDEDSPPVGLLQVADKLGIKDFHRCLVFHSLSKRSNLPGLRSGFVAGDGALMADYLKYRTYHGCTMSSLAQSVSREAWQDESHVKQNRDLYRQKFDAVLDILDPVLSVARPDAGFYLWPKTPIDDQSFAKQLMAQENVVVLPGSYLSRDTETGNPGTGHVRMALVAGVDECKQAAHRIRHFVESLS